MVVLFHNKITDFFNVSDLRLRIISSVALMIFGVLFWILSAEISLLFTIFVYVILFFEWHRASKNKKTFFDYCVFLYITLGTLSFSVINLLRYQPFSDAKIHILEVILGAIITDTAAYFTGRCIGGYKPFPNISPNKTLSGYLGGVLFGGCVPLLLGIFVAKQFDVGHYWLPTLLLGIAISMGVLAGDLLESAFKRKNGVKDTGKILPGHGGLFDRFDGLLGACIVVFTFIMVSLI